ncbi:MAG: hypothetical protein LUO93_10520 [Methanomicrobiales archaeon]|nr:hypothetical protein [Methanomicrobiales archaeon]
MARISHIIIREGTDLMKGDLLLKKLVSYVYHKGHLIIARYGVNKRTLKKLIEKETE